LPKGYIKRPSIRFQDRLFWIALAKCWQDWRSALLIVKPETVINWHRQGVRLYWRWKSKPGRPGRPRIDAEIRELIRRISQENPLWGAPRIQFELSLLGFEVAQSTATIKIPGPIRGLIRTLPSHEQPNPEERARSFPFLRLAAFIIGISGQLDIVDVELSPITNRRQTAPKEPDWRDQVNSSE
jgi:hypothetical protein